MGKERKRSRHTNREPSGRNIKHSLPVLYSFPELVEAMGDFLAHKMGFKNFWETPEKERWFIISVISRTTN